MIPQFDTTKIANTFVQQHLAYTDNTEPPKIFHIWSALTCISACLGRHIYLDTGVARIYGNMYTLLVGPPGTRKNTAIGFATRCLRAATTVRIAPDDTGGQRQGLIAALIEDAQPVDNTAQLDPEALIKAVVASTSGASAASAAFVDMHVMLVIAEEFGSFIGQNALDLTRFLIQMWDGRPTYTYRLKKSRESIREPLFQILGGTTPTDLAVLMPVQAQGQGFMARCILVYAATKAKSIDIMEASLATHLERDLEYCYREVFSNMRGSMQFTANARQLSRELANAALRIEDNRFVHYIERRYTHLLKLAMCLAAGRQTMTISEQDLIDAQRILSTTELSMPDALGEYGLSKIAVAKQKMLEYLRFIAEPISERALWGVMQRDMSLMDFRNALVSFINVDKVAVLNTNRERMYVYNDELMQTIKSLNEDALDAILYSDYSDSDKTRIN